MSHLDQRVAELVSKGYKVQTIEVEGLGPDRKVYDSVIPLADFYEANRIPIIESWTEGDAENFEAMLDGKTYVADGGVGLTYINNLIRC